MDEKKEFLKQALKELVSVPEKASVVKSDLGEKVNLAIRNIRNRFEKSEVIKKIKH